MILLFPYLFRSKAPWKYGFKNYDKYYLPIPPIFALIIPPNYTYTIIGDKLTINSSSTPVSFKPSQIIYELNSRTNVEKNFKFLDSSCSDNISQACLILGRIYEFGACNKSANLKLAEKYYNKVLQLNDNSSYAPLSFIHRHFPNNDDTEIQSVLEADLSLSSIESMLSSSYQHELGLMRPLSCPAASRFLLPIAEAVQSMNLFYIPNEQYNASQIEQLQKSSKPQDIYRLGIHEMNVPYPSINELKRAYKQLDLALQKGYIQAAAPYVMLDIAIEKKVDFKKHYGILEKAIQIKDPQAMYVAADLLFSSNNLINNDNTFRRVRTYLSDAAQAGYPPAIFRLAEMTYLGLLGIPRSNTNAFQLFSQAAATGHLPSMFKAAVQLIGGDGVMMDCAKANEMLKRIVDLGPWSAYFDKYVEVGSKYAFTKMIDMNLTPAGWINIDPKTEFTKELMETVFRAKHLQSEDGINKIRAARNGDAQSVLWLVLKSPLIEASQWVSRVELFPPATAILANPLKIFLLLRGVKDLISDNLSKEEKELLYEMAVPYFDTLVIIAVSIVLLMFVALRVIVTFD